MLRMLTTLGSKLGTTRWSSGRALTVALCAISLSLAVAYKSGAYSSQAYDRGLAEMGRGDWDGAILSFGEVIGFDMNNLDAYMKRGKCFYHLNNYNEAIGDFSHVLDNKPDHVDALLWRGTVNSKAGNHDASVRDYLGAIRCDPSLAKRFQAAGEPAPAPDGAAGAKSGNVQNPGAVKDYERAMALFLNQKQSDNLPAQTGLGSGGEKVKDKVKDDVAEPGRKAAQQRRNRQRDHAEQEQDGGNSQTVAALPDNDADLKKDTSSQRIDKTAIRRRIGQLNSALELDDRNPVLIYRRGVLYERLLNYDKALSDYSRAINLTPMEATYYLARARIYHNQDQPDLEQDDIRKAQSIDPLLPAKIHFVDKADSKQRENHDFKNPAE